MYPVERFFSIKGQEYRGGTGDLCLMDDVNNPSCGVRGLTTFCKARLIPMDKEWENVIQSISDQLGLYFSVNIEQGYRAEILG